MRSLYGRKISLNTVGDYVDALIESFIFYPSAAYVFFYFVKSDIIFL